MKTLTFTIRDTRGNAPGRADGDRAEHRRLLREKIRDGIADIISEESIIGQQQDRVIKVPIRGIKEYRFVHGDNEPQVGEGEGDTQPGQVVGKARRDGEGSGRAGDQPGVDYYETDVTLEELIEIMFEDLELPDMERKILRNIVAERKAKRHGYRKAGVRVRLDLKRSKRNQVRRKVAAGLKTYLSVISCEEYLALPGEDKERYFVDPKDGVYRLRFPMRKEDLDYRHHKEKPKKESNAVALCVMDTSGSMDSVKKYLARSLFYLLCTFVTTKYDQVDIVFVAHHTQAKEVPENEFFYKGESGGTLISSGYRKALDIITDRYHPDLWNIYFFQASDGDNFDSDNELALKLATELCEIANLFVYFEIKPLGSHYYESSMLGILERVADNFKALLIEDKEGIWPAFRAAMSKDRNQSHKMAA